MKKTLSLVIGTLFGIGFIKKMPGTMASISIAIVWYFIPEYFFYNPVENVIFYDRYLYLFLFLIGFSYLSAHICKVCEEHFGNDAKEIVIDEVIGYLFAVLFLPKTLIVAIYALVLFRIFDITKPFFIGKLQSVKGGWGVILDDIAAGITSNIIILLLFFIKPKFFMM